VALERTLLSLNDLSLEDVGDVEVRIVVVDNDLAQSARPVVDNLLPLRLSVEYLAEPQQGIPFARNTAVEHSRDADLIAFIDDDEWAERRWLAELLDAQSRSGADIAVGPVLPEFESPPPTWLLRAGYFEPLSFKALEPIHFAYTGNVLIAVTAFEAARPFREEFAVTGGSDTHFFMSASLRGLRIVWAPSARVHEAIPAHRMRAGWIARREFRRGTTLSLCLLDLEPSRRRRMKRVVHGLTRLSLGAVLAPAAIVRGRSGLVRAAQEASFGAGLLAGLTGHGYPEYRDSGSAGTPR
jgi:GT2 family glycosyltransferase